MASLYIALILVPYWLCQATLLPNLAGDILLTRLESPYDAAGDMLIPFGSTVTIESGTTLRFPRGAQLTVRGTLLARVNILLPFGMNAESYMGLMIFIVGHTGSSDRLHEFDECTLSWSAADASHIRRKYPISPGWRSQCAKWPSTDVFQESMALCLYRILSVSLTDVFLNRSYFISPRWTDGLITMQR